MAHGSGDARSLSFNSTRPNWDDVPDKTQAGFSRVFKTKSMKEVELDSAFRFPLTLLVSLAKLKYLAMYDVDLDAAEEVHSTSLCVLERLYFRGVSPGVIKILTKTLKFRRCPTHITQVGVGANGFAEAVTELIIACGSHLTSLAWLPSMRFRESTFIESRPTTNKDSRFLSRPNQHIHTLAPPPLSPLYHHISKLNPPQTTTRLNPLPFTPTPQSPQHSRKDHPRMSLDRGKPYIRQISR